MKIADFEVRLDQETQKPKVFFKVEIVFRVLKLAKNAPETLEETGSSKRITMEKVYGDFKRLHQHITDTFQNEVQEYERLKEIAQSGEFLHN